MQTNPVFHKIALPLLRGWVFIEHLLQRFGPIPYWDNLASQALADAVRTGK
jgi:hypothetical protein